MSDDSQKWRSIHDTNIIFQCENFRLLIISFENNDKQTLYE